MLLCQWTQVTLPRCLQVSCHHGNTGAVRVHFHDNGCVLCVSGKLKPTMAFMSGKLRIKGDMTLAIKLEKLMGRMNKAKL